MGHDSCSGCSADDIVTHNLDSSKGTGGDQYSGPETITVGATRSGNYRYYVYFSEGSSSGNTQLAASGASVKVYYNDTVTTFNVPNSAADLWYVFDFDISSGFTAVNNMGSDSSFTADAFAPTISEVTAVSTPTNDNATLSYTFSSNEAGDITYGGSCSSSTTSATADNNTITFNALADGTYSNCKISVTDNASNTSDNLSVRSFTIGAITPALVEVTPVPTPTNDNTSSYTFISTLSGAINYGGDCDSDNNTAVAGNNTITFDALAEGTYSNCKISVDNNSNTSDNLSVSSFTIDTTPPRLDNVTIASDNTLNTTLAKTGDNITLSFTSSETLKSKPSVEIAGKNVIPTGDNMTWSAVYTMTSNDSDSGSQKLVSLNIEFKDLAGNPGSAVTSTIGGAAVLFDKTPPELTKGTEFTLPSADNRTSYTFNSDEAGTINYGGSCSSSDNSDNSTSGGDKTITFDALVDGTYDNCTISVTDNASNTSTNLPVSPFTIGRLTPALYEVTPVPTPDNDNTSSYTFFSTLPGAITYGGSCSSSDNTTAVAGNNPITFNALAEGTYDNCTISVTDNTSNTSDNLSVSSFTIDITTPTLSSVTIASNNSDNTTLAKTGNVITLSITSAEAIQTPSVSISGQAATVTGSGTSWSAAYTMADNFTPINDNAHFYNGSMDLVGLVLVPARWSSGYMRDRPRGASSI